ncbi:MAG: hypothetical protein CMF50_07915 [Legionellales bacterium]|nr:hypothetical protein [Legionellales bacterium]|tara:strand:+ start:13575 stop:15155 length:1581 start_codon:yes stop_codon:yes gene_type:complete
MVRIVSERVRQINLAATGELPKTSKDVSERQTRQDTDEMPLARRERFLDAENTPDVFRVAELLNNILRFVDIRDISALSQVSRYFRQRLASPKFLGPLYLARQPALIRNALKDTGCHVPSLQALAATEGDVSWIAELIKKHGTVRDAIIKAIEPFSPQDLFINLEDDDGCIKWLAKRSWLFKQFPSSKARKEIIGSLLRLYKKQLAKELRRGGHHQYFTLLRMTPRALANREVVNELVNGIRWLQIGKHRWKRVNNELREKFSNFLADVTEGQATSAQLELLVALRRNYCIQSIIRKLFYKDDLSLAYDGYMNSYNDKETLRNLQLIHLVTGYNFSEFSSDFLRNIHSQVKPKSTSALLLLPGFPHDDHAFTLYKAIHYRRTQEWAKFYETLRVFGNAQDIVFQLCHAQKTLKTLRKTATEKSPFYKEISEDCIGQLVKHFSALGVDPTRAIRGQLSSDYVESETDIATDEQLSQWTPERSRFSTPKFGIFNRLLRNSRYHQRAQRKLLWVELFTGGVILVAMGLG